MKKITLKTFLFSLLFISFACSNDEEIVTPTVSNDTTVENANINYTSITITGNVSNEGSSEVISRGVCWSESPNPTITEDKTSENSNAFVSIITELKANTTYYFRTYATSDAGTSYSTENSFTTLTIVGTTWDFTVIYDEDTTWHANVTFNADGTTVYDEPESPGIYTTYGTWTMDGNILTYIMDSEYDYYHFTGTVNKQAMNGTFTFQNEPDKNWVAVKI
ncbi:hypothetical protein HNQ02_001783 [Flavobacterium sp. 7E]|uniref:hypothetical protein n=1 Tax=Flavobacterium sp. 7E TaxID=2735898 RepID=UPI001570DB1D|nr:hypothetical protein [Flavobacterium sp. 7E]NRS88865.1 hypothetical protein [Flavobacterium sp. 7E]